MSLTDYKDIFVFAEQMDGKIASVSYELIGKAKELATVKNAKVIAVLLGSDITPEASRLARYGADKVIVIDDPALKEYITEPYAKAVTQVVLRDKPEIMLYGATAIGRDLAPRVSARIHTGLTADCTALAIDEGTGNLLMTRPAFGGNIMATIECPDFRPQMATVRPGVMQRISPIEAPTAAIEQVKVEGLADSINVEIMEIVKQVGEKIDIMEAKVLVSGGRGIGSADNYSMLEDLAHALGGTIASSRANVDAGWAAKELQVGQTGKTVRPNLYIACGISGAIQHMAGMEESEIIIAINTDPTAPIFEIADFGIVGDVTKVVPLLTEAINKAHADRANA